MREGSNDDSRAEGMREFIELCQMKFGDGRADVVEEKAGA